MAFRKIAVDNKEYLWKYVFDEEDCQMSSFLVVKTADKKGKMLIGFGTGHYEHGYCPFNKGVPAVYQNQEVLINLNQPRFAAEIIRFACNRLTTEFLSGTIELNDGIDILHQLGYQFEYPGFWQPWKTKNEE